MKDLSGLKPLMYNSECFITGFTDCNEDTTTILDSIARIDIS